MYRILLLGSGMVVRPLVRYLSAKPDVTLGMAARSLEKAKSIIGGRPIELHHLDLADSVRLKHILESYDVAISMLPYTFHVQIAQMCLETRTHLVTTSYVSEEMQALDLPAKDAGLIFLNEIGLDPGIDHMTAMRVIDRVHQEGGKVIAFQSACGGLPSPEAITNPLGYKFSWSPRGVVLAARNAARYLKDGQIVEVPSAKLFEHCESLHIEGLGTLEMYPNRDALIYRDRYGLSEAKTVFRGTLRNAGWCSLWRAIVQLGLLDLEPRETRGMTIRSFVLNLLGADKSADPVQVIADRLNTTPLDFNIYKLGWIGLFEDRPIDDERIAPLDLLVRLLEEKLAFGEHERDMIVLYHNFIVDLHGQRRIESLLVDFGQVDGDSAMARTVSLPAAIGAYLIATGQVKERGVIIPVTPELYEPVLQELQSLGIHMNEKVHGLE